RFHVRDVKTVDVGTFFAVDFDRHERFVQYRRNARIGIRLLLHDVAPMTGEIADREKDWLVLLAGLLKSLIAPRIPIHRIVRMEQEIRTLRVNQSVRVAVNRRIRLSTWSLARLFGGNCGRGNET